MTLPLAPEERRRPARSCLGCRMQKHKCCGGVVTGADTADALADSPCQRCARLNIDCVFAGLKRIGRPRRLAPGVEPARRTLKLGTSTANVAGKNTGASKKSNATSSTSNPNEQFNVVDTSAIASSSGISSSTTATTSPQAIRLNPTQSRTSPTSNNNVQPAYALTLDHMDTIGSQLTHNNLQELAAWNGPKSPLLPSYSFTPTNLWNPLPIRPINTLPPFDFLALADRYTTLVHPFLALFTHPTAHEIAQYLANSTPILAYALSSLLDSKFQFAPPPESFGSSIADLQAGLIVTYASHGRGESVYARENVKWISQRMIKLNWHLVDNPETRILLSESEKQDVRKIFWETWSVDILLGIVTGSRNFALQGLNFEVHLTESMDASSTLKIRAISLLLACTEPPPPPPATFPATRTPALTSLGSTIYILSYAAYTARPNYNLTIQDQVASRESAFMAILISSASTIYHLSSSSAFSSFMASAFPCGLDTLTPHAISKNSAIRMASNQMFDLVKMDSLPGFLPSPLDLRSRTGCNPDALFPTTWDPSTTSTSTPTRTTITEIKGTTHSPFYSCAVFVASQGALLTFGLDDNSIDEAVSNGNTGMCGGKNEKQQQPVLESVAAAGGLNEMESVFGLSEGGEDIELCGSGNEGGSRRNMGNRESFSSSGDSYTSGGTSPTSPQASETSASSTSTSPHCTDATLKESTSTYEDQNMAPHKYASSNDKSPSHQEVIEGKAWRAVEVRSQLDLADYVLETQSKRYTGVVHIRKEVKALRISKSGMNGMNDMLLTGM